MGRSARLARRRDGDGEPQQQQQTARGDRRRTEGNDGGRRYAANDESVRVRRATTELEKGKLHLKKYLDKVGPTMLQRMLGWIYQQQVPWTERASKQLRELRDATAEALLKRKRRRSAKQATSLFITGYVDQCMDKLDVTQIVNDEEVSASIPRVAREALGKLVASFKFAEAPYRQFSNHTAVGRAAMTKEKLRAACPCGW